jgi:hypothetical protein
LTPRSVDRECMYNMVGGRHQKSILHLHCDLELKNIVNHAWMLVMTMSLCSEVLDCCY